LAEDWSLLITAPNRERAVSKRLERRRYEHLLFWVRRQAVRGGKVVSDLVPAFPGYIFVVARGLWLAIRDVVDVVGFVTFGDEISRVPRRVVDQLTAKAQAGVLPVDAVEEVPLFLAGMRVRVLAGSFSGYYGTFVRFISTDRALILADRRVPLNLPVEDIERADDKRRPQRRGRPADDPLPRLRLASA